MARYLVTGGAGFIGSHLASLLLECGQDVCVLDNLSTGKRANVPGGAALIVGDVRDHALVSGLVAQTDGCFHLAAIASVQACSDAWRETHQTNLSGAINVFEAALRAPDGARPVVYASSAAVYGDSQASPLTEDAPTRPLSAYGADKLGCELHAHAAAETHGFGSVGLRFFNVYGPRQDPRSPYSGVISIFADRLASDAPVTIHGDGEQTRDFVFVSDVCSALWGAMLHCRPGVADVLNVCTGREISVRHLADTISRLVGSQSRIEHGLPRAGDIRRSVGSPRRLIERLGKGPRTMLDAGLAETLQWMRAEHERVQTPRARIGVAA